MSALLDVLVIAITGLLIGNEVAIATFVHPAIAELPPATHLGAARSIARLLGLYMPFWYGLGLVTILAELWLHHALEPAFHLLLTAALLWIATIVLTLAALLPRNNRIAAADLDRPYVGWQTDRAAWDRLHRLRVVILTVAFVFLVVAVLPRPA